MSLFKSILRLEEVDSTNDYAKRAGLQEGAVVVSRKQSAGRGRKGKSWISSEGGLFLSLVLKLERKDILPRLTLVFGVALHEALGGYCNGICLKWPNDVLLDGKKICGILCESSGDMLIVGIGVNVNNDVPLEDATSLNSVCGCVDVENVLDEVLSRIRHYYSRYINEGFSPLREEWKKRSCIMGRMVVAEGGISGIAEDIDEYGCLVISNSGGKKKILAGDISISFK